MTPKQKRPAYQFYPGDEDRDAGVRACSLVAYGLWKRMLNLMHDGAPYGHLTSRGKAMEISELARLVGASSTTVKKALAELEDRGVFSRTDQGVIYSRRMVRDEHIRIVRAQAGNKGGNPALTDPPEVKQPAPSLVKQTDNQTEDLDKQKRTPAVASAVASAGTTDNNNSTHLARERAELTGLLPEAYRVDLDQLLDRVKATHDSPAENRRLSWLMSLKNELAPAGSASAESLGKAIRALNTNGELNWNRFLGYVRSVDAPESPAPSGTTSPGSGKQRPTSARDLEAEGLVIWGELVDGITQQYRANDPDDKGAGGSNVWVVRAPTWDKMDEASRRALRAIGGPVAIATANAERKGFLSAQFAKTYAGARMQTAKATAAA